MATVLLVEDDPTMSDVVIGYLRRDGYDVRHLCEGDSAAALLRDPSEVLDLAILDLMLPGVSGQQLCQQIRRDRPNLPVILLTALTQEEDRIAGLTLGADDYVTKPFSPRELVLRVGSILRRASGPSQSAPLIAGSLHIDPLARRVTRRLPAGGELGEIALTARELDVLIYLASHPGEALSREQLMAQVWGWSYGDLSTVTVHVRRIRAKVEADPAHPTLIQTVWGVGYRWNPNG
ncbi:MAG: response regulator transcription factor [Allobranchiibius sp.]